jgi:hypothetical protein
MNTRSFVRTLVFGAFAALTAGALGLLGILGLGLGAALVVAVVVVVPSKAAAHGRDTGERARAGGIAFALVASAALLGSGPITVITIGALALAVVRSHLFRLTSPLRTLLVEACLGAATWIVVGLVVQPTPAGAALGAWAFFLGQSAFFLVGDVVPRTRPPEEDAFERAARRARATLERGTMPRRQPRGRARV